MSGPEDAAPAWRADAASLGPWLAALVPPERCAAVVERLLADGAAADGATRPGAAPAPAAEGRALRAAVAALCAAPATPAPVQALATRLHACLATATFLLADLAPRAAGRPVSLRWPAGAGPQDVVDWLQEHAPDRDRAALLAGAIRRRFQGQFEFRADPAAPRKGARLPDAAALFDALAADAGPPLAAEGALAARAFVAWRAIEQDLRRPIIAVDADRVHHEFVTGWRGLPKGLGQGRAAARNQKLEVLPPDRAGAPERCEILAPNGRAIQLTFPLDGMASWSDAVVTTLRDWQGPEGIRHWAALHRLFSIEGGRSGAVRWTLDTHLDALGYAERARRDPAVRRRVANQVEILTKLELAVYAPDGKLRARQPLIAVGTKYDALRDSEWALEGMELRINQWLYRGVRDPETGELGTYWYPAPAELAQIDHSKFPYAIVLGLILPMRWRWDLGKRDYCALAGSNLLATAGIPLSKHNPGRTWETLRNNLEELVRRRGLERYEWIDAPWTLTATCRLYSPQWTRDRAVHGLRPLELPPPPQILTGGELRAWREAKGWSQTAAATALGVGERTLRRAEATPAAPLGHSIQKAFAAFGQPPDR